MPKFNLVPINVIDKTFQLDENLYSSTTTQAFDDCYSPEPEVACYVAPKLTKLNQIITLV